MANFLLFCSFCVACSKGISVSAIIVHEMDETRAMASQQQEASKEGNTMAIAGMQVSCNRHGRTTPTFGFTVHMPTCMRTAAEENACKHDLAPSSVCEKCTVQKRRFVGIVRPVPVKVSPLAMQMARVAYVRRHRCNRYLQYDFSRKYSSGCSLPVPAHPVTKRQIPVDEGQTHASLQYDVQKQVKTMVSKSSSTKRIGKRTRCQPSASELLSKRRPAFEPVPVGSAATLGPLLDSTSSLACVAIDTQPSNADCQKDSSKFEQPLFSQRVTAFAATKPTPIPVLLHPATTCQTPGDTCSSLLQCSLNEQDC